MVSLSTSSPYRAPCYQLMSPLSSQLHRCFTVSHFLESFLRNRSSLDHEATAMMKAQFMSLWDGLDTSSTTQVGQTELPPNL